MEKRLNAQEKGVAAFKAMYGLNAYLAKCSLDKNLLDLIYFRVSQINGCAYCLDMHSKDLLARGESAQRLFVMDAWRDTDFYSDRERAAMEWAEALTRLGKEGVSDDVYRQAASQFTEDELMELTIAVIVINSYNRVNIAFRPEVGGYVPGQFAVPAA